MHPQQAIKVFRVAGRQKRFARGIASPQDFALEFSGEIQPAPDAWPGTVYCADFENRHLWFTECDADDNALTAPLLWAEQYASARRVTAVPFERLVEFNRTTAERPTLIFSIGRCGSTLLSRLLVACGVRAVSEPDLLTQLATVRFGHQESAGVDLDRVLMQSCLASFAVQSGGEPVIKLRSQCNRLADALAREFPDGTFVMLLREPTRWLRSRFTAFGGDPKALARLYRDGIVTYDRIVSTGVRSKVVWYEDMLASPLRVLQTVLGRNIAKEERLMSEVQHVMMNDSQRGTPLGRDRMKAREISETGLEEFWTEWQRIRPNALIARHSLARLE